ncbi:MAG: SprT-like domain-containing protein [Anaerolineae bacterium]|nr:SprT-like domain-containing protein [Phycisphaerae bacterium]
MTRTGKIDVNLFEAKHLANDLLKQHGLSDWTFRFDHARRRFGSCQWKRKVITLSRPLTLLNGLDQVRDTILHEIAHALTPGDNHGAKWKQACRRIGAKPARCFTTDEVIAPPRRDAPFQIGCAKCLWWVDRRRLACRQLVCTKCRSPVIYRDRASGKQYSFHRSKGFQLV